MSFDLELVDSDLRIQADGTLRTVEKTKKLRQDVIKVILTPIGDAKFHPWYGSNINENSIGNILPEDLLFENLSTAITESLERLLTLQRSQATQQRVSLEELIAVVQEVQVDRDPRDPRVVHVRVLVLSKSLSPVEEVFSIRS